jgi:hypothetical protein
MKHQQIYWKSFALTLCLFALSSFAPNKHSKPPYAPTMFDFEQFSLNYDQKKTETWVVYFYTTGVCSTAGKRFCHESFSLINHIDSLYKNQGIRCIGVCLEKKSDIWQEAMNEYTPHFEQTFFENLLDRKLKKDFEGLSNGAIYIIPKTAMRPPTRVVAPDKNLELRLKRYAIVKKP